MVVSLDSSEEATIVFKQLNDLCNARGFQLVKWMSNNKYMLKIIRLDHKRLIFQNKIDIVSISKVFGLPWDVNSDTFYFDVKVIAHKWTKRSVLSIARLWNPLRFLALVISKIKLQMKELWCTKIY